MPRIRLRLEYDGTDYVGYQAQLTGPSIQNELEKALRTLLGEPVALAAAGRTDSGVHAEGQVVCFDTHRELPMKAFIQGLNGLLPPDIAVRAADVVDAGFDPRRGSMGKRYRYLVSNRRTRSPLRRRTHWEIFQPLDVPAMARAATFLVGEHDYSAFRAADCQAAHARRVIRTLAVESLESEQVAFTIEGTAFLKHMVRNIVGTLVLVGKKRQPPEWVAQVLAGRDRTVAGPTAPAQGLTLLEVFYAA